MLVNPPNKAIGEGNAKSENVELNPAMPIRETMIGNSQATTANIPIVIPVKQNLFTRFAGNFPTLLLMIPSAELSVETSL